MVYKSKSRKTQEEKKMQKNFEKEEIKRKQRINKKFKDWKRYNPKKTMLDFLKEN